MRARAKEIPGEIERETEAIKARFANPQARMFPVAVTFLVPEKLAGGDDRMRAQTVSTAMIAPSTSFTDLATRSNDASTSIKLSNCV